MKLKHSALLILLLLSAVHIYSQQPISANAGGADESDYLIVLPYDAALNLPVVNVEIRGKQYRFLFDTGAGTCITRKIVDEIMPESLGKIWANDSEARYDSLAVYSMPEIVLDGVSFKDIPSTLLPYSALTQNLRFDGIIGSNMVRNSVVRFSHPDRSIYITDNAANFDLDEQNSIPLIVTSPQSRPAIKTFLKDQREGDISLIFDSGFSNLYDISLRHFFLFREHGVFNDSSIEESVGRRSTTFFGPAPDTILYRLRLAELKVADTVFKNVSIGTTANENSRMGAELFLHGIVTLDFIGKRFYFEPFVGKEIDLYMKQMPIHLVPEGNKVLIGLIWDKALRDKISPGDQVLSIDGSSFEESTAEQLFIIPFDFSAKDSYLFRLKDKDGNIKEVTVEKK